MGRRSWQVHRLGRRIFAGSPNYRISSEPVKRGQFADNSPPTISGHKVHTGREDYEERYEDCSLYYFGRPRFNRVWATAERARGLRLTKHRRDWTVALSDDSVRATPVWHGEDRAYHHSRNHRPLSRG